MMKNPLKNLWFIFTVLMLTSIHVKSQVKDQLTSLPDPILRHQTDSLKENFASKGFIVVKEALMRMESDYAMPVIVPLSEGSSYEFAFIGDVSSNVCEVRMYDQLENQVVYEKQPVTGNIISYSYIPKISEYHIIKPLQVNKKKGKNVYGYIILFKKTA
jgi:hypothetical protein